MELANLVQTSDFITVTFPDSDVVKFTRLNGFEWTIEHSRKDVIDQYKVNEFVDGYLNDDSLLIKFYKVTAAIMPRKGGEQV